jgi:hypothetical protein
MSSTTWRPDDDDTGDRLRRLERQVRRLIKANGLMLEATKEIARENDRKQQALLEILVGLEAGTPGLSHKDDPGAAAVLAYSSLACRVTALEALAERLDVTDKLRAKHGGELHAMYERGLDDLAHRIARLEQPRRFMMPDQGEN